VSEGTDVAGDASVAPRLRVQRSKLTPPKSHKGIAPRGQLLDRLREGRHRKLTLVCAPAGYGKTTLLAQWYEADRDRLPFVWVSADESDSDPVRFWSHLIAGLHDVHPPAGAVSGDALRAGPGVASEVVSLLVDELADAPPLVLVVDDWHLVRSPVSDESMRILLEQGPPAVQVVLSSRSDPNLPVGRWRVHGELGEVRAADLQLSHVDAASFLREANAPARDAPPADPPAPAAERRAS